MRFTKMQGIGNDYIYLDCMNGLPEDPPGLSVRLSDRHFGVGSDGIILVCRSEKADFRMVMYNADGSEAEMCGNGIRCFARYVRDKGLTAKDVISIETKAGIKTAEIMTRPSSVSVRINMGLPVFRAPDVPVKWDGDEVVSQPIDAGGEEYIVTCLSVGNPHCVVFTDTPVDTLDLERIGPIFEHHPMFPNRVNAEFVNIMPDGSLKMRVWERGSGETLACGTGACAVGVAAIRTGAVKGEKVTVRLPGGDLIIEWPERGEVFMTGAAEFVFEGEV